MSKAIHVVTQKKGGIGKSVIAGWLAQYLEQLEGERPLCFDADSNNHTFAKIKALQAEPVKLLENGEVNSILFEELLQAAVNSGKTSVIDTGSSTFLPFWSFARANQLFPLMEEEGYRMVLHVPLAAAPNLDDTLQGFGEIADESADRSIVVWLNEREKPILDREQIAKNAILKKSEKKVLGVVVLQNQRKYMAHRESVRKMLSDNLTFAEMMKAGQMFQRSHIRQVRDEVFGELDKVFKAAA